MARPWVARLTSRRLAALRSIMRWTVLRPVSRWYLKVRVTGRSRCADLDHPLIVIANHSSHWDSVLLYGYLPAKITRNLATAAAADHFFHNNRPALAPRLFFNAFPVERPGKPSQAPRGLTGDLLAHGASVLIFPEGTRSRSGDNSPGAFNPGTAALAVRRDLVCLPVKISGTWQAWPPHQSRPRRPRRPVTMTIGKPIRPAPGETVAAFNQRLRDGLDGATADR